VCVCTWGSEMHVASGSERVTATDSGRPRAHTQLISPIPRAHALYLNHGMPGCATVAPSTPPTTSFQKSSSIVTSMQPPRESMAVSKRVHERPRSPRLHAPDVSSDV
jgi:hypothetical protein